MDSKWHERVFHLPVLKEEVAVLDVPSAWLLQPTSRRLPLCRVANEAGRVDLRGMPRISFRRTAGLRGGWSDGVGTTKDPEILLRSGDVLCMPREIRLQGSGDPSGDPQGTDEAGVTFFMAPTSSLAHVRELPAKVEDRLSGETLRITTRGVAHFVTLAPPSVEPEALRMTCVGVCALKGALILLDTGQGLLA